MKLTISRHYIGSLSMGAQTSYANGALTVSRDDVECIFPHQSGIRLRDVFVAAPGASLRFGPVLDVVGMRCGLDGTAFPGICGPAPSPEARCLHVIERAAVTVAANIPGIQEGIIDMTAFPYTPFAGIFQLVCVAEAPPGQDRELADSVLRRFQCRLAEFIAAHSTYAAPGLVEDLSWPPPAAPDSPRAGVVYLAQSQGELRRTYFEGRPMDDFVPREVSPAELLSGAVVSGNYVLCCNKTCTYIHQEQPVVRAMLREHGKNLAFSGVILAAEASSAAGKEENAARIAALAGGLGWRGAIINQEGGGNTDTDIMLVCRELEKAGIATVLLVNEFAGADGATPSLADVTEEAAWMVSTGNNDFIVNLPAVESARGFLGGVLGAAPHQAASLPLARLYASTNQLGFNILSCDTV